jgi:hypothetical protein
MLLKDLAIAGLSLQMDVQASKFVHGIVCE